MPCSPGSCKPWPGRTAEAHELLTELGALASPLGLYGEEVDPPATATLANYPEALTDAALAQAALTNTTVHGIAGSAWVWPDSAWIAVITSVVISRRRWRRLPA